MNFTETLNQLLVDKKESERDSVLQDCIRTSQEYERTRYKLMSLENKLKILRHKLNCELALKFRREFPNLNVNIYRGNCKVGYKTKHLIFSPDFKKQLWIIDSADQSFANKFKKLASNYLQLNNPLTDLISVVADFFKDTYKSLGEDIEENSGQLIIEGKEARLFDLLNYARAENVID